MTNTPILQLEKVSYEYRNKYQTVRAVKDFSYEFFKGNSTQ